MKTLFFIILFFIISGCSVFQPEESILIQPKLVKQSELPAINQAIYSKSIEFFCEMLIDCNGDVERAKLLTSSGDPVWDSLTQVSLLSWKYSPAIYDGHPVKLTIRRKVKVVFEDPKFYSLAEIQLQNYERADSVYKELLMGKDFSILALMCSVSDSKKFNGIIGNVNIKHFNESIRVELAKLGEGEFTKPLAYGDRFVIYKRLKLNN